MAIRRGLVGTSGRHPGREPAALWVTTPTRPSSLGPSGVKSPPAAGVGVASVRLGVGGTVASNALDGGEGLLLWPWAYK